MGPVGDFLEISMICSAIHMGVEPKIGVVFYPPNHPFFNRVWNHYFHHPFWGVLPLFLG